jgi:hypothetical protein
MASHALLMVLGGSKWYDAKPGKPLQLALNALGVDADAARR